MVFVQDGLGGGDVQRLLGRLGPGQRQKRVQIVADDRALGDAERRLLQPVDLLHRPLRYGLGHPGLQRLGAVFVHLAPALVALAQFLLDSFKLLAQQELALRVAHFLLDAAADVLLDLEYLGLFGQQQAQLLQPLLRVQRLQKLLLGLDAQRGQVPGDVVGQRAGVFEVQQRDHDLGGDALARGRDLLELGRDRAHQRLGFERLDRGGRQPLQPDAVARLGFEPLGDPDALLAFQHDAHGPVGDFEYLDDLGDDANLVQVVRLGVLGGDLLLRGQQDVLTAGHRLVQCPHGLLAPDEEREDDAGEVDVVADGQ